MTTATRVPDGGPSEGPVAVLSKTAADPSPDGGGRRRGGGWRPALRIARRTVRRNLGRSLLVAALVGVPVAGATLADGLYRTFNSPERDAYQHIADGDALIEVTPFAQLGDDYYPYPWGISWSEEWDERDPAEVDLPSLLPAGSTLMSAPVWYYGVRVERGEGTIRVEAVQTEPDHPRTANTVRLSSGEWPRQPDEVLISESLADRLDLLDGGDVRDGATLTLHEGPDVAVTGLGVNPFQTRSETIFAAPDSTATAHLIAADHFGDSGGGGYGGVSYIADFPAGTDADALWPELADQGVRLVPRAVYGDPDRYAPWQNGIGTGVSADVLAAAGLVVLVVGLGLLEVVLLAGAAFAVSARRQVRGLGLIASNGGTARQVRRIVYAQGFVLGGLGAVLGLAVGFALMVGGIPLWELASGSLIDEWHFGPAELAIAATVGLLSGLAAAIVPARGAARLRPIDALAQRFRATPLEARLPKAGLILLAVGSVGALAASRVAAGDIADYGRRLEEAAGTGVWVNQPNVAPYVALQLLGAVLAVAGLIMITSPLLAMLARRLRRWPLSSRYAARDAARHRHRTTPAVAAIMIVVAGATGLTIGVGAVERVSELQYTPYIPENVIQVNSDGPTAEGAPATDVVDAANDVATLLPGGAVVQADTPGLVHDTWGNQPIYLEPAESFWESCGDACDVVGGAVQIGTPELYELQLGSAPDQQTLDALDDGAMVVLSPAYTDNDGMVKVTTWDEQGREVELAIFPPHEITYTGAYHQSLPSAFISAEAAAGHGWEVRSDVAYVTFDSAATDDEIDAALDAAERAGLWASVERGCEHCGVPIGIYLALVGGATLVTLVGVGVVVALAAAEGRADLATMGAVGAPPRLRRSIAGWQALVVGGLGTALGLALGSYYAYLIWPAIGAPEFFVPWEAMALIGLGVPLLAAALAALFTRSKLPMVRRIE